MLWQMLCPEPQSSTLETDDVAAHIDAVVCQVPVTPQRMEELKQQTAEDPQLQTVLGFIRHGWPEYMEKVPESVRDFYQVRGELSELEGSVTRGCRIVIPTNERDYLREDS